jgi:hypothetical protein
VESACDSNPANATQSHPVVFIENLSLVWYLIVGHAGRKIGEWLVGRLPTLSDQVCY